MRLLTVLPKIRGERTVKEIAAASGVNQATYRQIENGRLLPLQRHVAPLEAALGAPVHEWYPAAVLLQLITEDKVEP